MHGLPATRAHRQIIAKAFNMPIEEKNKEVTPENKISAEPIKFKSNIDGNDEEVDVFIPENDLPVDPNRLKKAIKTALIKNENNPDKIDI